MNTIKDVFLTAEELSKYFALPLNTIYRLSKTGKIKGVKIGRHWRYPKSNIEEFMTAKISPESIDTKRHLDFIERRKFPRINCSLHCEYRIYIPVTKKLYSVTGDIINISAGGIFLNDKLENIEHISIGDPVDLYFKMAMEPKEIFVSTEGRIVWKIEIYPSYGVGLKFRNIDADYQKEIMNYIG